MHYLFMSSPCYQYSFLSNQVGVATAYLPDRASAAVGIFLGVGGRHETSEESGLAHFLEHILFKGTTTRSASKIVQEIEGNGGSINAYTCEDSTCYEAKGPVENLPKMIDVLVDMVLHPAFSASEIEKEREVILEELTLYKESPSDYVQEVAARAFWGEHPLGRPIIGTKESLELVTEEKLRLFHQHYHSCPHIVVVASSRPHEEVCALVESCYAHEKGQFFMGEVETVPYCVEEFPGTPFLSETRDIDQCQWVMSFPAPGRTSPHRHALRLFSVLWGETMSSRLFQEIREKRGLAYSIYSDYSAFEEAGVFSINVGVDAQNEEEVLTIIRREIQKLLKKGCLPSELKQAKRYLWGQFILGLDSVGGQMSWMGDSLLQWGYIPSQEEILEDINKVTLADMERVVRDIFENNEGVLARVGNDPLNEESELS